MPRLDAFHVAHLEALVEDNGAGLDAADVAVDRIVVVGRPGAAREQGDDHDEGHQHGRDESAHDHVIDTAILHIPSPRLCFIMISVIPALHYAWRPF